MYICTYLRASEMIIGVNFLACVHNRFNLERLRTYILHTAPENWPMGNDCSTVEVNSNVTIPEKAIFEKKYPIWEILYTNLFSSTA